MGCGAVVFGRFNPVCYGVAACVAPSVLLGYDRFLQNIHLVTLSFDTRQSGTALFLSLFLSQLGIRKGSEARPDNLGSQTS